MPEVITCPSCNRKLKAPDHLMGRMVQCPTCGRTFTAGNGEKAGQPPWQGLEDRPHAPEFDAPAPPAAGPVPPPSPAAPLGERGEGLHRCPYCGESVAREARRCR